MSCFLSILISDAMSFTKKLKNDRLLRFLLDGADRSEDARCEEFVLLRVEQGGHAVPFAEDPRNRIHSG